MSTAVQAFAHYSFDPKEPGLLQQNEPYICKAFKGLNESWLLSCFRKSIYVSQTYLFYANSVSIDQAWISGLIPEWLWMWGGSRLNTALRRQADQRVKRRLLTRSAGSEHESFDDVH